MQLHHLKQSEPHSTDALHKVAFFVNAFAVRLKKLRNKHKINQTVLEDLLSVSQRVLSYYEKGEDTPPLASLIILADYFDVSLDYLVRRADKNKYAYKNSIET